MKILTWNIWFKPSALEERTKYIIEKIKELNIDILFLQEVNSNALKILEKYKGDYNIYKGQNDNISSYGSYDTIILAKKKYKCIQNIRKEFLKSKTNFGRNILHIVMQIELEANKVINFNFINIHLESLRHSEIRKKQFYEISKFINEGDYCIIGGDTNFLKEKEEPALVSYLKDAFIDFGSPQNMRWSYDGEKNVNVSKNPKTKKRWPPSRLDRIYLTRNIKIENFSFVGQENTIPYKNEFIPPSDHFGILCEVSF